ncbi:MAG: C25 family cysteine peptidase [Bacteroidales bacterium]|nr:C25 family cysteine peptidase [Bacteroidales bacterium]MDD3914204.1 C25 family cysteine peptidase [Bacteroidales bacterium]MDD4634625.1 C25 family cysteine peptidase [Bacteroidales bacterium]
MKKNYFLNFIILFFFSISVFAQDITINFDFPTVIQNGDYIQLQNAGCVNIQNAGEPQIPQKTYNLLLAQNTVTSNIVIKNIEYYDEIITGKIQPVSEQIPISSVVDGRNLIIENDEIYKSDNVFPSEIVTFSKTNFLCGHGISSFIINSAEYYPANNTTKLIKSITFTNESVSKKTERTAVSNETVMHRIKSIANNYDALSSYSYSPAKGETVDILIITDNSFAPYFEDYIEYKRGTGFFTEIIDVNTIYGTFPGRDNQEKIRNCIIDYYDNHNLKYVILGGDADGGNSGQNIVPCRGLACPQLNENDLPADLYYSNLDGTWDDNNNNLWGENTEMDPISEISVGRICASNAQQVTNSINKIIKYQETPVVADIEKALMVGEQLNNDPVTWGGDYKDEVANGTDYQFSTQGITDNFTISTLYDRTYFWSGSDLINYYSNSGIHLLNHLGHSNVTYNMKLDTWSLTTSNFSNNGESKSYVVSYSQGCYAGSFDNRETSVGYYSSDCFAEVASTIATANVATIANSRYGWYVPGGTGSSSQFYDRLFYQAFFHEYYTKIGDANAYSKDLNPAWFSNNYNRWTAYELNLFGDPTMDIWTAAPTAIEAVHEDNVAAGTKVLHVETDASFARLALLKNGELVARMVTPQNGDGNINISEGFLPDNEYTLVITAHNKYRYTSTIDVTSAAILNITSASFSDANYGNNDNIMNYGETISLLLTINNIGNLNSDEVVITTTSDKDWATVLNPESTINSIAAGSFCIVPDIKISVSPYAPADEVTLSININDEFTYSYSTNIAVANLTISSSASNDNGDNLSAGETGLCYLSCYNSGNYPARTVDLSINKPDLFTVLDAQSLTVNLIEPNETIVVTVPVAVSETCPDKFIAPMTVSFTDELGKDGSETTALFIGDKPVAVVDLRNGLGSTTALAGALNNLTSVKYSLSITPDIFDYDNHNLVFISLNSDNNAYTLNDDEVDAVIQFIDNHGTIYVEGGSLWSNSTLNEAFGISSINDNSSTGIVTGTDDTFTENMLFNSTGVITKNITCSNQKAVPILKFNETGNCVAAAFSADVNNFDKPEYKSIVSSAIYGNLTGASDNNSLDYLKKMIYYLEPSNWAVGNIDLGADTVINVDSTITIDGGADFSAYYWNGTLGERYYTVSPEGYNVGDVITVDLLAIDYANYFSAGTKNIVVKNTTGINTFSNPEITVYPNPARDILLYNISSYNFDKNIPFDILDVNGKVLLTNSIYTNEGSIDVSNLNSGVYFLKIKNDDFSSIIKFIVL